MALRGAPAAQKQPKATRRWGFLKTEELCATDEATEKVERQPTEREMSTSYLWRGFTYTVHKELVQLNNQETNNTIKS